MKVIKTAAMVVGAVALVASGVGAVVGGAAFLTATGVSLATVSAIGTVAGLVGTVATAISPPKAAKGTVGGSQTEFKLDPNAGIPYTIGRTYNAGNIAHRDTWGTDNQYQGFVVTYSGGGTLQGFEAFLVEQSNYGLIGDAVGGTYNGWMWNRLALPGTPAGPVTSPVAGFPGLDNDFRMSGHATGVVVVKFDVKNGKKFSGGMPRQGVVAIGERVYDPRQDSTYPGGNGPCRALDEATYVGGAAAENPWCHALTWALGRWQNGKRVMGVGQRPRTIDMQTFVDAMNVADANGWKLGGVVYSIDNKWDVLRQMAQAGGGQCLRLGARLAAVVNAPKVALATITEQDLTGRASVSSSQTYRDRLNGMIPKYRSEAHGWEMVPASVVRVASYVAADGEEKTREWPLPLVQAVKQAGEIAAYELVNRREFGPITVPTFIRFMGYKPGDAVKLQIGSIGLVDQLAVIRKRQIDPTSGNVQFAMVSETTAKHAFALGQTSVAPPIPDLSVPDESVVAAPQASDWDANGGELEQDGVKTPAIILVGDVRNPIAEAFLVEIRPVASPDWTTVGQYPAKTTRVDIVNVAAGASYYVGVSFVRRGVIGERVQLDPVTAGPLVAGAAQSLPADGTIGTTLDPVTGKPSGGRPVVDLVQDVAQSREDVADLYESLGSSESAAASAAAANASKVAAELAQKASEDAKSASSAAASASSTAASNADKARQDAQAARDAANTAAGDATSSANLADTARAAAASAQSASEAASSLADTKAKAAAQSATDASGYASTSSAQATIATQQASAAGQSASTASASKDAAATSASAAGVSAGKAATSETNAAGSASAAATSQSVTARAALDAAANAANDNRSPGAALTLWGRQEYNTFAPAGRLSDYPNSFSSVNGVLRIAAGPIWHVHPVAPTRLDPAKRFRAFTRFSILADGEQTPSGHSLYATFWDNAGNLLASNTQLLAYMPSTTVADGPREMSRDISADGADGSFKWPAGAAWVRVMYRSSGVATDLPLLYLEDVDALRKAAERATAAATSASSAAASETKAGQSATAASTSATNASTSAGNASTSASHAARSETNAAGSASTAETKAGVAATAADNAGKSETNAAGSATNASGSASAAAGSASAASASQSAAAQSATAASGSATTASTKAGEASTSAGNAATSATNAAGSASSAATSASTAATARQATDVAAANALYLDVAQAWDFSSGKTNGFTTTDYATVSPEVDGLRLVASGADPLLMRFGIDPFLGRNYQRVVIDLVRNSDTPWDGALYYQTVNGHGWDARFYANPIGGAPKVGVRTQVTFDMTQSSSPPDWLNGTINGLRFDLYGGGGGEVKVYSVRVIGSNSLAPAQAAKAASDSASAASASQTAAGQSASAASTSATNAATSASNASTSASNAATSETNAAGSASTATTQASLASGSAGAAGNSATAAAGSASAAATSAKGASDSASAASTSATNAATSKGQAETAAGNAATSETNAAGSASAAFGSQTVSARAAQDAAGIAASDGSNPGQALTQWTYNQFSVFQPDRARTLNGTFPVVNGRLRIAGAYHIHPLTDRPLAPGRRYQVLGTIRAVANDGNQQNEGSNTYYLCGFSADGAYYQLQLGDLGPIGGDRGDVDFASAVFGLVGSGAATTIPDWVRSARPMYRSPGGTNVFELVALRIVDVTEKAAAADSASASAASASAASASQTAAGQSASSAATSATNAGTSASNAGTSATNASKSETNAAGSASAAASSQSVAASAAQSAQGATASPFSPGQAPDAWSYNQWNDFAPTNTLAAQLPALGLSIVAGRLRNTASTGVHVHAKKPTAIVPGRRYRAVTRMRILADGQFPNANIAFINAWDANGTLVFGASGIFDFGTPTVAGGEYVRTAIVGVTGGTGLDTGLPASARWARLMYRTGVSGGAIQEIIECGISDVEGEVAAAGSASASASSASAASASQTAAGQSATAASTSATNAAGSASNASSSAGTAAASASSASGSASAAQQSASIAAQVNSNLANKGGTFSDWPGEGGIPSYWQAWGNPTNNRVAGLVGRYGFQQSSGDNAGETGLLATTGTDPGLIGYRGGVYVVEADVFLDAGSLRGSGILFRAFDQAGNIVKDSPMGFSGQPSQGTNGAATGDGTPGARYRYAMLATIPANTWSIMLYLMTAWGGFEATRGKTLTWYKAGVRPATQQEIAAGKVDSLSSSVTTLSSAVATIDGRTAAYWSVSAQAGGARAAIEARAVTNPDGSTAAGVGIVAEEFTVTSTANGVRRRVVRVAGQDVVIDGNLSSTAGVFLGSGAKWSYQLKQQSFRVTDGQVVDFGVNLGAVPAIDINTAGLDVLGSGETYRVYSSDVSATGFKANLKIVTPGATSSYTLNAVQGGSPTWQAHRGSNPAATSGAFQVGVSGTYTGVAYRDYGNQ